MAPSARVHFYVGKGGVGKSTIAAATALRAAREGSRVLLVSIDQAHSLTETLGVRVSGGERELIETRWEAVELDSLALVAHWYSKGVALVPDATEHEHGAHFGALGPQEIIGLPGAQEIAALHQVAEFARCGEYDQIVVDCPGIADTLRTLSAPSMAGDYLERIWPRHSRMLALNAPDARAVLVVTAVERLVAALDSIRELLGDRERTSLRVVTSTQAAALSQTRKLLAAAALSALRVDAVIVNNASESQITSSLTSSKLASSELSASTAGDGEAVGSEAVGSAAVASKTGVRELVGAAPGAVLLTASRLPSEPVGLSDLSRIAAELYAAEPQSGVGDLADLSD
ncbi:MAG: ArsA family ATPase, partial [Rhodococcus sp.]|nr:ArsA family ATPase [Rhodococcus sp. (in: high G+C Gram-positive bacteria)]